MRDRPPIWQLTLVLIVGIIVVSTAAVLVRLAAVEAKTSGIGFSLVLAASRLLVAAALLIPAWRGVYRSKPTPVAWRCAGAAGIALALHFATWISSLSYTSIAAATTLVTTNPVWIALLSWLWFGEQPSRRAWIGMGIALIGGVLVGLGDTSLTSTGSNPLLGNGLALVGAWAFSLYFLMGREAQRNGLGIGSYSAITYSTAAIALLPLPPLVGASYGGYSPLVYGYILLTALLPQLVGHTSFNWAVRWVSPTLIALVILLEPVLSSLLGYIVFDEVPGAIVFIGALVLLVGVAIAILN